MCQKTLLRTYDDDLSSTTSQVTIVLNPLVIRRTKNARLSIHATVCFSFTLRIRSSARELMVT